MEHFNIELARLTVGVSCAHPYLKRLCRDYRTSCGSVDFEITTAPGDIERERTEGLCTDLGYLEGICVLRKLAETLPLHRRVVFHGAAITCGETAYLFTAPSGTGKSTHIALWKRYLGDAVDIVNGDKPILSAEDGEIRVHGTPWGGKENWQKNREARLGALCFLHRGRENRIRRAEPAECIDELFHQVYLPRGGEAMAATMELLDELAGKVPLYVLECDMSMDAVRCSFEALTGRDFLPVQRGEDSRLADKEEGRGKG